MFQLLSEKATGLEFFVVFNVFGTGHSESFKGQVDEKEDGDDGEGEDEMQEGDVIVLQVFLCVVFLEKGHFV